MRKLVLVVALGLAACSTPPTRHVAESSPKVAFPSEPLWASKGLQSKDTNVQVDAMFTDLQEYACWVKRIALAFRPYIEGPVPADYCKESQR